MAFSRTRWHASVRRLGDNRRPDQPPLRPLFARGSEVPRGCSRGGIRLSIARPAARSVCSASAPGGMRPTSRSSDTPSRSASAKSISVLGFDAPVSHLLTVCGSTPISFASALLFNLRSLSRARAEARKVSQYRSLSLDKGIISVHTLSQTSGIVPPQPSARFAIPPAGWSIPHRSSRQCTPGSGRRNLPTFSRMRDRSWTAQESLRSSPSQGDDAYTMVRG